MIEFTSDFLLSNLFKCGKVFYFINNQLPNTKEPHYHIVIGKSSNKHLLFVCCTTQWQKRLKRLEILKHPLDTLVHIPYTTQNGLKKETYVDCNNIYSISIEEFKSMYKLKYIEYKGEIEESYFNRLKKGVDLSLQIETYIQKIIVMSKYLE